MPYPTRLGRQPRPTVTGANLHKNKYKVNNPKVSIISLPVPRNWQQQRRHWPRTRNRQCVRGIVDSGTKTAAAASQWRALGSGNHNGDVGSGRWAGGLNDDNGGVNGGRKIYNTSEWTSTKVEALVCLWASWGLDDNNEGLNWGRRKYNASEWTSLTAEAPVCFRAEGFEDNNIDVWRVRHTKGLSDDDGGISRQQGIRDAPKESETTTDAEGDRRRSRRICNNDRSFEGGRWSQRQQQRKRMRRRRIEDASKVSKTKTEVAEDRQWAWWIRNYNNVLILLDFKYQAVTMSCLFLVAISFWYCFHQIPFFCLMHEILLVLQSCKKYFCTKFTLTLRMYPLNSWA